MTELTRFKHALDSDTGLRLQYLKILDSLMTDGEITPEMTSVAAKKLGFKISAGEFGAEGEELSEGELEAVNGGRICGEETSPDGRKVGCPYNFYFTWTDYWIENPAGKCPKGGRHELDPRCPDRICKKCRLALGERGVLDIYDATGRAIG